MNVVSKNEQTNTAEKTAQKFDFQPSNLNALRHSCIAKCDASRDMT